MAYLNEKIEQLGSALKAWKESLDLPFSDISRDAAIQRYEFTFELCWKAVKTYLKEQEAIECYSPKACFREIKNILGLTEKDIEICLRMAGDRNLSVHTYSEKMANQLYEKLKGYLAITEKIFNKLKKSGNFS
jgi:nucleotidyltransferase substrate binding protein (TIGR01987 family)